MKQSEIKPCQLCGEGVLHSQGATFMRVSATYLVADFGAIRQQHGLEMSMGAAAPLAAIMGPDRDMAKPLSSVSDAFVCLHCMMRPIAELLEKAEMSEEVRRSMAQGAKFENVSCSQCGRSFGPGDHGYSHCSDHEALSPVSREAE